MRQLGRMLALAGIPMGLRFRFLDPNPDPCAAELGEHVHADYEDERALARFTEALDAATIEFENIPPAALKRAAQRVPVLPGPRSLETAKDRLEEKRLFDRCEIPTAPTRTVDTLEDLEAALAAIGSPAILKRRTGGYDGKGQAKITSPDTAAIAFASIGERPAVLQGVVEFDHECSIVAVRSKTGEMAFYPLAINTHTRGILTRSVVPAEPHALTDAAVAHATKILNELDHVGVLTIEFFVENGALVANEIAPRVHNTGHWTIDAARTSQFENHLRAILGWPLGDTACTDPEGCAMLNCIGAMPPAAQLLEDTRARLHDYAKQPRPGRKVGHITRPGATNDAFDVLEALVTKTNALAVPMEPGKSALESPVIDNEQCRAALKYAMESEDLPSDEIDIDRMKVTQHYEAYTDENHEVWNYLYQKRMEQLVDVGSNIFLSGIKAIGINDGKVPDLRTVNDNLKSITGWSSHGVPGYLPGKSFFAFLAQRQFPTTITVRPKTSMDYLPEPDIIHDVFGHVPLHADPVFAEFLQTYGKAALHTDDKTKLTQLGRIFWFTVEFGLINEDNKLKLYGAGLISSEGEGHHALKSSEVERRPFDLKTVC
ncbi:purK, partial [Symbiodinium necroappetens]